MNKVFKMLMICLVVSITCGCMIFFAIYLITLIIDNKPYIEIGLHISIGFSFGLLVSSFITGLIS